MKIVLNATSLVGLFLLAFSPASAGQITYSFAFTPNATPFAGSPISPFSFSFTSPGFVTGTSVLTFDQFSITDGVHSELIAAGESFNPQGLSCFVFGTSSSQLVGCDPNTPNGTGVLSFTSPNALPTTTGTYSYSGVAILNYNSPAYDGTNGSVALTVSTVDSAPEPSGLVLLTLGLCAIGILRVNARRQDRSGNFTDRL